MPKDEADEDDPMEMVGVEVRVTDEELREVARCFIEEFAWLGYDRGRLLGLFQHPEYQALHGIYQQKGADWVASVVDEVAKEWGR